jgi:Pretoxin HINT domain/Protein of unknown function (DUF1308)
VEAAGATCNSFAPATAVVMADGSTKRIEDVKVGDKVLATDPTTGRTEARPVTQVIVGVGTKHMVELTVEAGGQKHPATITATDGHPFWSPDLRRWVTAGELTTGSMLQTGDGAAVKVTATKKWTAEDQEVRNLTVDGLHTYYVAAAGMSILVHNCGGVMLDASTARAMVSADRSVANRLSAQIGERQMHMTDIGLGEFNDAVTRLEGKGLLGPTERGFVDDLLSKVNVVQDNPSARALGLKVSRKVGANDIQIFGTADRMGIPIFTADMKFLMGAHAQGLDFDAFVHPPINTLGY